MSDIDIMIQWLAEKITEKHCKIIKYDPELYQENYAITYQKIYELLTTKYQKQAIQYLIKNNLI